MQEKVGRQQIGSTISTEDEPAEAASKRRSLRPLAGLAPYLLRYRGIGACALGALLASIAMLVPTAVRRMIDYGFSGSDPALINHYFMMLIAIGGLLAVASQRAVLFRQLAG